MCVRVYAHARKRKGDGRRKGTERKQWNHYLPVWLLIKTKTTSELFNKINSETFSQKWKENKYLCKQLYADMQTFFLYEINVTGNIQQTIM